MLCSISSNEEVVQHSVYLSYKIKVVSGSLWNSTIRNKQYKIYSEIKKLRKEGLTYKQISKNLNDRGWTTIRGKKFVSSGVHSSEWKMERRMKKMGVYKSTIEDLEIEFDRKYD